MKKRFDWESNNEDDDMNQEQWGFDGDEDEHDDDFEMSLKNELINVQLDQVDILQQDVDEKIMQDAIMIASIDWLWSFKSSATKLKIIKRVYIQLKKIMDG